MSNNAPQDMFASSFSSSRSRWNTKCKRDSAAPPIWLRRVLNDATNVDTGSVSGVRGPGEHSLFHGNSFVEGRQEPQHCAALDGGGDRKQWQNPPAQGIGAEDATELYLNPLAFGSCNDLSRQVPGNASVPHEGGGYAAIHAQAAEWLPNHGGRAVQSARRTRIPLLTSDRELGADGDCSSGVVPSSVSIPLLSVPVHSRATPRIGTPLSHATTSAASHSLSNLPPMRDELATFRETHLHHLRQLRSSDHYHDQDEPHHDHDETRPLRDAHPPAPSSSSTADGQPLVNASSRRLSRAEERHLREWAGTLCVPSEAMDLGLALRAASAAPTTFSASSEADNCTAAHRPSGLRRADPNSGFAGDLSATLASRPPRARPSSLDQREEHAASQPTAPSREHARTAVADAAFGGDLASVLSGARRQVRPSSLEVREGDIARSGRDSQRSGAAASEVSNGGSVSAVWQGDLSSVLGGGRNRLRAQLEEARREMGRVGPVRQNAAAAAANAPGSNGSWMLPAAAAARDAQQQRQQQAQRTGVSATAPYADSMFWPEGQEMSYDALLALDRAAIQKGVPKSTLARIKKKRAADEDVGQECAVCMDNIEAKQWLRKLPCGHVYHDTCICKWFEEHVHCPLCRFDCVQNKPAVA